MEKLMGRLRAAASYMIEEGDAQEGASQYHRENEDFGQDVRETSDPNPRQQGEDMECQVQGVLRCRLGVTGHKKSLSSSEEDHLFNLIRRYHSMTILPEVMNEGTPLPLGGVI